MCVDISGHDGPFHLTYSGPPPPPHQSPLYPPLPKYITPSTPFVAYDGGLPISLHTTPSCLLSCLTPTFLSFCSLDLGLYSNCLYLHRHRYNGTRLEFSSLVTQHDERTLPIQWQWSRL